MLVLTTAFAAEFVIMLALASVPDAFRDGAFAVVLDAAALVLLLGPALWLLVVRPLRVLVSERGRLLSHVLTIQEAERARIGQDLHDELGQTQTAVLLRVRAIIEAKSLDEARRHAEAAHAISLEAMEATRRLARGLSPVVLKDFGLSTALERLCEDMASSSGIEIEFHAPDDLGRFDAAIEMAVFRVAQESLVNAARHANATRVRVHLTKRESSIELTVADDGRGIAPRAAGDAKAGLGLAGMRERVVLVGGTFHISSASGAGTAIRVVVPAREERA